MYCAKIYLTSSEPATCIMTQIDIGIYTVALKQTKRLTVTLTSPCYTAVLWNLKFDVYTF